MSTTPTRTVYISPEGVIPQKGDPQLSATVMKGSTTSFTAYVLDSNDALTEVSDGTMTWCFNGKTLPGNGSTVQVTPPTTATAGQLLPLTATYNTTLTSTLQLSIAASDILIAAPDGYVYRVPGGVWANVSSPVNTSPSPNSVTRYLPDALSEEVQHLLTSRVSAANIPNPPSQNPPIPTAGEPSDNITCFLLNLNSLLANPVK